MEHSQAEKSPSENGAALDRALALVEFLRANCAWDAAQTPGSLRPYLLEEANEVVEAITEGRDDSLRDELGDLLLNLAFQVVLAEERAAFDRESVVTALEQKMRRRHPHLFGLGEAEPWDVLKARERAAQPEPGFLGNVGGGSDPTLRAYRMQERVAEVGFDWPDARGAWEKVREEVAEVGEELDGGAPERLEEEIGDLLFSVVNLARRAGVHPAAALSAANQKFARRFTELERLARERKIVLGEAGLDELDVLWEEIKRIGRDSG